MVITIASMKGGVGKTTIAAMMARYISDKRSSPVVVIDMDPQRGATITLLGAKEGASITPPTIYDILQSELANMPSTEIFAQAMRKSPYSDKIFVVPANGDLARIMEEDTPPDLLRIVLEESPLSRDVTVIVDTGSGHKLCEMSVAASDVVFIPLTLGQQSGIPTTNTVQVALEHGTTIGGIIPLMVGEANWEKDQLKGWRRMLVESEALREMNVDVLQGMPYSRLVIRGRWRWGKIPRPVLPALDEIYRKLFREAATSVEAFSFDKGAAEEVVVQEKVV
jgi:MinD-like ATPase involved in chromosome partitioning or flagellar assembly